MEALKPHEITVIDCEGRKITMTTHWDSTLDDWKEIFKTILIFLTFPPQTVAEFLEEDYGNSKDDKDNNAD